MLTATCVPKLDHGFLAVGHGTVWTMYSALSLLVVTRQRQFVCCGTMHVYSDSLPSIVHGKCERVVSHHPRPLPFDGTFVAWWVTPGSEESRFRLQHQEKV